MKYDLAILGGGPAGVAAGVYAARKQLKTVYITDEWGGQSTVSEGIENWIGTVKIPGQELANNLKKHLEAYAADIIDIRGRERATGLEKSGDGFKVKTDKGEYEASAVFVATGSSRRKLPAVGADVFEHKGLTYCASCDGPLFRGMDTLVVGGGNSAFEAAAQLLAYAKSVTLVNRTDKFRADPVTVQKVSAHPSMKIITNAVVAEVKGDKFVNAVVIEDANTHEKNEVPMQGIFVEIGAIPNTGFLGGLVDLNDSGHIKIDPWTQKTSVPGVWAAGDVTDGLYHQNNIAAGDAVKALEDIYIHLKAK